MSAAAGCYRLFVDTASGALDERPELAKILDQLRPADTRLMLDQGGWPAEIFEVRRALFDRAGQAIAKAEGRGA